MSKTILLLCVFVCAICTFGQDITQGSLYAHGKGGKELGACPLKNTAVKTEISGFIARVNVRQEFENSFSQPIEAVYTFPLSQNGAVDSMAMTVGERVIHGEIMKREEARKVYEDAKAEGKTASLLDQERPNIFTQSVANIMPGDKVVIEISYVETLKYEEGSYEWVFPMTVGPRYIPGSVKDAAKIKPPVAETRSGSDISIDVNLNAGVPVEEIRSTSHAIDQTNVAPNLAKLSLRGGSTIPNKDFILRYDVTGKRIEDAVLTHRDERGGFFTLILQPPDKIASEDRTPKEIVFVLDTSGSMEGFPIEKAKEAMKLSLAGLYPDDTFNLITFAGDTSILFDGPVPATKANLERAQAFLESRQGSGGTEMMKAIKAALEPSDATDHIRIVCFMTDGYVGNEEEIIGEVQKHPNARVFSFGIGSSVNRYLLDKIAESGRGEVEYVSLTDDGSNAAKRFYERVRTPLLTDLSIDWNGMPVADVYPGRLNDLFSAKPVILHGRYTKATSGTIRLKGKVAGQEYTREIKLDLPDADPANDSLASLWARTRIDDLSTEKLKYEPAKAAEVDKQILGLGMEYRLLSQFTSFVAVEDRVVNQNGKPTTVQVPVNLPEGVSRETTVGNAQEETLPVNGSFSSMVTVSAEKSVNRKRAKYKGSGSGSGVGYGTGSGSGGGIGTGSGRGAASGNAGANRPVSIGVVNSSAAVAPVRATKTRIGTTNTDGPVDLSETKISADVTRQQIAQLPVNGRSVGGLLALRPGVARSLDGRDGSGGGGSAFSVDGSGLEGSKKAGDAGTPLVLSGKTVLIAEPAYPAEAKAAKALGEVAVDVKLDLEGTVVSAKAVSGEPSLREAAEAAAMLSKFAPVFAATQPVRVSGTILYNFKDEKSTEIALRKMKAEPLSPEDLRAMRIAAKLHFWLYDLVMRLDQKRSDASPNEALFVRDGWASVRVVLMSDAPSVMKNLQEAGLQIDSSKGKTLTGRIAVDKIGMLADLEEVSYVFPKM
jgi:Ca-activated chloride channel family protein